MTSEGHILFSIASLIVAYKLQLTFEIVHGDWIYMLLGASIGSLLPDIDHKSSLFGRIFFFISFFMSKIFSHRGFTHSLLSWIILIVFFYIFHIEKLISNDLIQAFLLGYISHHFADMLTPYGVSFLWPLSYRFSIPIIVGKNNKRRERCISIILIGCYYIFYFKDHFDVVFYFNKIINFFKILNILEWSNKKYF
ncbi:metal-dependent hydrolase [Candidatus Providencia siddallii]|uniref:Inner membrane protein YdjM n=1 Tax=Candidatus Providencia siddallii TaxID=1715285 RepID=A0ABP1CGC0_9GAMM